MLGKQKQLRQEVVTVNSKGHSAISYLLEWMTELERRGHYQVAVQKLSRMLDTLTRAAARRTRTPIDPSVLDRWEAVSCLHVWSMFCLLACHQPCAVKFQRFRISSGTSL